MTAGLLALWAATCVAPTPVTAAPTIAISVANDGSRSIDGFYLSLYADRGWGPDQLNGVSLASGAAVVVSNVACTTASIVAIAEDAAGCFFYRAVPCGGDTTWTISNDSPRDCGH